MGAGRSLQEMILVGEFMKCQRFKEKSCICWSDFCKDKKLRLVFTSGKHVCFFLVVGNSFSLTQLGDVCLFTRMVK